MGTEVTLRSAHDGTTLRFGRPESYTEEGNTHVSFVVSVAGPMIEASARVDGYESPTLASYFEDIAANWKGWSGERAWANLEDEFSLTAKTDSLGHVYLSFTLRSGHHDYAWTVTGTLELESGQLESIAKDFAQFYGQSVV